MAVKRKIINDPVFGFISIPRHILDVLGHPYVERLSRIRQMGLSNMVYPGAMHTRFLHSIGAMHLMSEAINQLRQQGVDISMQQSEAARLAILLHDTGHGPFSHVLEHTIVTGISHEEISLLVMKRINEQLGGKISEAIKIFTDSDQPHFLHQLVSSQLDVDRLDYLSRDSFFCGVSEGMVASARIINMLNVVGDRLVVESKGIYSVEKFLLARRLMYWQVYLHKTSVIAEQMLTLILRRARELAQAGKQLPCSNALGYFMYNNISGTDFRNCNEVLDMYMSLDDTDVMAAVKMWRESDDIVLKRLCSDLLNRRLFKITVLSDGDAMPDDEFVNNFCAKNLGLSSDEARYFHGVKTVATETYKSEDGGIGILMNDGRVVDLAEASDILSHDVLNKHVRKHYAYQHRGL
jgi:HD superfamily phosphohydrolase